VVAVARDADGMSEALAPAGLLREAIGAAVAAPTLCEAFQITARANAGLPALREAGSDRVVTWDEYQRRVRSIATGLHALGVRAGDPVALLLRNRPEFHLVDAAVLHLGATPFSLYHTEPVERLRALAEDSGVRVIVTETLFASRATEVLKAVAGVEHLVIDGDVASEDRILSLAALEQLENEAFDFEASWRAVDPETIATLVYTSGTTGEPKAVQIPHRAIMHSLAGVEVLAPATPNQRCVSFLPNAHISDRFMCHYSVIGLGGSVTSVPDHERLWDTLREVRPTRFHGVPRTFEKLADAARAQISQDPALEVALEDALARVRGEQPAAADDSLRVVREQLGLDQVEWLSVAAAPSAYAVLELHHALGLALAEVWGMSEFMMATMNPPDRVKLGTVGIPLASVEARLADDGEFLLRGPHACAGYRGDPEKTAAMHDADGWVHSGDPAAVDDDGYYRIVGRKKEQMINSSGKNLFPAKIEAAIKEGAPLLAHVAVIADRRRYVAALIVLDPQELAARGLSGPRAEAIADPAVQAEVERAVAAGNERLARVEQIRAWAILDADWQPGGPELTNTLKLRRSAIDERYAGVIESLYA
jgi:long-subunit acyl-CoA synthetase (AMP-forming)